MKKASLSSLSPPLPPLLPWSERLRLAPSSSLWSFFCKLSFARFAFLFSHGGSHEKWLVFCNKTLWEIITKNSVCKHFPVASLTRSSLWNLKENLTMEQTNPACQGDLSWECYFVNRRLLAFNGIINCIGKLRFKFDFKTSDTLLWKF